VLNAAGALVIGERADSFRSGVVLANELIDSGACAGKLRQLREMSNSFGK
jgi:anthranilate phosphoribosyltransferase